MLYCPREQRDFSIAEARRIVQDLFKPKPLIYWTDFLLSLGIAAAAFFGSRLLIRFSDDWLAWSPLIAVLTVVTIIAVYRAALFTHELTHLPKAGFGRFRMAWDAMFGVPMLMPSFLYHIHLAHHMRRHYGTSEDGEYLPWANSPRRQMIWYLAQSLFIPALAVLRFGLLTPLSWISPRFRRWLIQRASSMVIDASYIRPMPTAEELKRWRLQEVGCCLMVWGGVIVASTGLILLSIFAHAYLIAVGVVLLNAIRTLGAHRYRFHGEEVTFVDQLLDSVNYPNRPWLGELWAPVGLRFHALHHLFPSMPYHALPAAHRRLMAELPADSPYRDTVSPSLWQSLRTLWREAGDASRQTERPETGRSPAPARANNGASTPTRETAETVRVVDPREETVTVRSPHRAPHRQGV